MFENYRDYLGLYFSSDYWADCGIDFSLQFLREFSQSDWLKLQKECCSEFTSVEWKMRCAETLSDVGTAESLNILMLLLRSENEELVLGALDSINSSLRFSRLDDDLVDELICFIDALPVPGVIQDIVVKSLKVRLLSSKKVNSEA